MLHYAIQGFETGAVERVTRGPSKPPFLWATDPVGFIISEALWVGGAAISLWMMVAALLIFATGRFPRNKSRGRPPSEYTEDPKLIFLGMMIALAIALFLAYSATTGLLAGLGEQSGEPGLKKDAWEATPVPFVISQVWWFGGAITFAWVGVWGMHKLAKQPSD
jgi:hypothetical protein